MNCISPKDVETGASRFNGPLSISNVHSVDVHCLPLLSVCASAAKNVDGR